MAKSVYHRVTHTRQVEKKARTYRLDAEIVARIEATAERLRVWPGQLVDFLLRRGLDAIESGEWEVPTRPAYRQIIEEDGGGDRP